MIVLDLLRCALLIFALLGMMVIGAAALARRTARRTGGGAVSVGRFTLFYCRSMESWPWYAAEVNAETAELEADGA